MLNYDDRRPMASPVDTAQDVGMKALLLIAAMLQAASAQTAQPLLESHVGSEPVTRESGTSWADSAEVASRLRQAATDYTPEYVGQASPAGPLPDSATRPDQWSGRPGLPALMYLHGGGGEPPQKGTEHWISDANGNRMRFVVYERNGQLRIEPHDWVFPQNGGSKYRTLWQDTALLKQVYDEAVRIYQPDVNRIILTGDSRGAHGTTRFGLEHPELFAALLASQPRWLQTEYGSPGGTKRYPIPVDEVDRLKSLPHTPFIGWSVGKRDSYTDFSQHIRAARALIELRRPFVFAWNNGDHGGGALRFGQTIAAYKSSPFDRSGSLPVFSGSSCDDEFSAPEGGINLGFQWQVLEETETAWKIKVRNVLGNCSVDVQPYGTRIKTTPARVDLIKDQWQTLTFRNRGSSFQR